MLLRSVPGLSVGLEPGMSNVEELGLVGFMLLGFAAGVTLLGGKTSGSTASGLLAVAGTGGGTGNGGRMGVKDG